MRSNIFVLMFLLFVAACQTDYNGNEASPYYQVPAGSRVILNQSLTVRPDQTGVLLQEGKVVPPGQLRTYDPHCKLELRTLAARERAIAPDEFVVTRAARGQEHSVDTGARRYAALAVGRLMSVTDDNTPSIRAFVDRMYLGSDKQPDVFRLSCGRWGYPGYDTYLSINDMRRALGNIVALRLAPR